MTSDAQKALEGMPDIFGAPGSSAQQRSMEKLLAWYDANYKTIRTALQNADRVDGLEVALLGEEIGIEAPAALNVCGITMDTIKAGDIIHVINSTQPCAASEAPADTTPAPSSAAAPSGDAGTQDAE